VIRLLAIALLAAVMLAPQSLVSHLHEDGTPGLYNEEHILAAVAMAAPGAPLLDAAPSGALLAWAEPVAAVSDAVRPAPTAAPQDSRAPPIG
jgi:hypothetical protein